jgi:hypothetical protein
MASQSQISTVLASAVLAAASLGLMTTFVSAKITIDDSGTATVAGIQGSYVLSAFFDASGSDKLIVTVSMERDRPDPNTTIAGVTYSDIPMTQAIQFKDPTNYDPPGIGPAAIFYLDNPGPAGAIVASGSAKMNGAHASWLAVSGTGEGVGPTNGTADVSASISTTVSDSLVVAHNHVNQGAVPVAQAPLNPFLSSDGRYSEAASGYQIVSGSGTSVTPTFSAGNTPVTVVAAFGILNVPQGTLFMRGDGNADGEVNITDGIFSLNFLFLGGPQPPCLEASDANDDGEVNITDGIYILNFLFLGGPGPADPGASCGPDPVGSLDVGCERYDKC